VITTELLQDLIARGLRVDVAAPPTAFST
jgi:hypothetical protein